MFRTVISVLLILLPVFMLGHVRYDSSLSRLPESGRQTVALGGLHAELVIRLDARGIPHIRAENQEDLFFAQGYVEARDRFFRMDVARRRAEGRLSEVFGVRTLEKDRIARLLRFAALARRQKAELDENEKMALESFAAGVNAALKQFGSWIAPEIRATGIEPEAWKIEDSLAIAAVFSFDLSASLPEELRRWQELTHYGPVTAPALWGWNTSRRRSWIPPMDPALAPSSAAAVLECLDGWGLPGPMAEANAWVLAGRKTASGRPLVAVDPHGPVEAIDAWYAIDLQAGSLHAAGLALPGLPGLFQGHNEHLSWVFSGSMMDDMDLYEVVLNGERSSERIDGKWVPLRTVREEIRVRWSPEPVVFKLHLSRSGPVIFEQRERALALRSSLSEIRHPLGGWLKMLEAAGVDEVGEIWKDTTAPSLFLLGADDGGHVFQLQLGKVPRRGRGAGKLPAPGGDSRWAWRGYESPERNLSIRDPGEGMLVAANEDLFSEGAAPGKAWSFSGEFSSPWRARRLRDRLGRNSKWSVDTAMTLLRDDLSPRVLATLRLLRPELEEFGGRRCAGLLNWDGRLDGDSREALVFQQLIRAIGEEIGGDEASLSGMEYTAFDADRVLMMLAGGLSEKFWDDRLTSGVEDREKILMRAVQRVESMPSSGVWKSRHRRLLRHPLHQFPLFGRLFSFVARPSRIACGGDDATLFQTRWDPSRPFRLMQVPNAAFVVEAGNWDHGLLLLPGGESGRLWSSHSRRQRGEWLHESQLSFPFSRDAVEADCSAVLRLLPEGG